MRYTPAWRDALATGRLERAEGALRIPRAAASSPTTSSRGSTPGADQSRFDSGAMRLLTFDAMSDLAFPAILTRDDPDLTARHREVFVSLVRPARRHRAPVARRRSAHHGGQCGSRRPASAARWRELEAMGLLGARISSSPVARSRAPGASSTLRARACRLPRSCRRRWSRRFEVRLARSAHDVEALLDEALVVCPRSPTSSGWRWRVARGRALDRHRPRSARGAPRIMVLNLARWCCQSAVLELESPLERDELDEVSRVLARPRRAGCRCRRCVERFGVGSRSSCIEAPVRLVTRAAAEAWAHAVATPLFSAEPCTSRSSPEFASAGAARTDPAGRSRAARRWIA